VPVPEVLRLPQSRAAQPTWWCGPQPRRGAVRVETEGFDARCLLHELDHLDGIVFLDRVDSLSTDVFRRKQYR
jgi:Polypeptide deformylase